MAWALRGRGAGWGRRRGRLRAFALAVFAAAAMLAGYAGDANAVPGCVSGTSASTCVSETRSASATVIVPGNGTMATQLQQALAGPNGAAIANALGQVLGPGSFSQSIIVTVQPAYTTFGPATLPVGSGPGTINCSGLPSPSGGVGVWPVANCNFAGYDVFMVGAGTTNVLVNTHTAYDTNVNISANSSGQNWLDGDLHTTFQTTLIDSGFSFIDLLLSRGTGAGGFNLFSPSPLAFAPDTMAVAPFEDALAFATKAPRVPMTVAMGDGWRAWIRGSLGRARFDGDAANFGFSNRTASGEGGIERVAGNWLYGAAFGFGYAKINQDVTGDFGSIDTFRAGAYASYRPGPWSITAAVAAGFSSIDATRLALLPVPATSSYDATTWSAGIEAVRRYQWGAYKVEPLAGLVYTGLWVDSFIETGTTFLDLAGNRAHIDALKGYVGGRVSRTYTTANGWAWTPEARGRLLYDFLDDPRGYSARFVTDPAGTPFAVNGLQPDRFAVMIGGAVTARFTPMWQAFASYDAEIRGGDVAHLVSGGVKGNW